MPSMLCRRPSIALLSLYDLETFTGLVVPDQIQLMTTVKTIPSKSTLEDLPNELLIDIFEFLSPHDLHRGIYNLNLRLNRICEIQKLHLDFDSTERTFDYYCSNQQPFASQIYSLELDDIYNRLTLFNQYINIELFTNLRMLSITEPSSENLDRILSKLYLLPHLSYLQIYSALIQSSHITSAIFKIRSLKQLILHSTDPIILSFNNQSTPSASIAELEYLDINGCFAKDFFESLKYIGPNVKQMKISLLDESDEYRDSINLMIIDELLSNHKVPIFLRRIQMKFHYLPLTSFHLILRLFPHLTHLNFSTLTSDMDFISSSIWHEFISTYLLELTQLQFHIRITDLLHVAQCPSNEVVDSFCSVNSKWLIGCVVMDYYSSIKSPILEFYTSPQSVCAGKCFLQLYDRRRYIATTTITHVPINIDKNITHLCITLTDGQQIPTTTTNGSYPKVKAIAVYSQMTSLTIENHMKISSIMSNIIQSIPDLSKITSLFFISDSSFYPSTTLTRRLLDKIPKVSRLVLPCNYLFCLLKSPLIVKLLTKKIDSLTLEFHTDPPKLADIIRILDIFSTNLHFLYFNVRVDYPAKQFHHILPLFFSERCKNLYKFKLRLCSRSQQPQSEIFDEQFQLRLKACVAAHVERNKTKFGTVEYRIKDNQLSIWF